MVEDASWSLSSLFPDFSTGTVTEGSNAFPGPRSLRKPAETRRLGAAFRQQRSSMTKTDFRGGGADVFRCGDEGNPQYHGLTTYYGKRSVERTLRDAALV
jgi:hypothetical protein